MVNVVRILREQLHLTLSEFAKVSGFKTLQQVSNLERGVCNIGLNRLVKTIDNLKDSGHKAELTIILHINGEDILIR
jgi:transcriptional regulator with XRE-family HTH domain